MKATYIVTWIVGILLVIMIAGFFLAPVLFKTPQTARRTRLTKNVRQMTLEETGEALENVNAEHIKKSHAITTSFGFTADEFPRIDGSLCTQSLDDMIISTALDFGAVLEASGKSSVDFEIMAAPPLQGDKEHLQCYDVLTRQNRHHGTHEAYVSLLNSNPKSGNKASSPAADMIFVTRKPTDDERKLAASRGITFDIRPVAYTAIVFLVNPKNRVQALTLDQLRAIYTGKVTNWKSLGGDDQPILYFRRDKDFGSEELMQVLFSKKQTMIESREMVVSTKEGAINEVARHPGAMSFSLFYYEQYIPHKQDETLVMVDDVVPLDNSISDRRYPLIVRVYAVTRKDLDPQSPAGKVRNWLLTTDGQMSVVLSGGYGSEILTVGPAMEF